MANTGRISIFDFTNYRQFLKAVLNQKQEKNKSFSIGSWAKRLELKGNSALVMILNGQRNPSSNLIEKLSLDLELQIKEASYFRDLISFEKSSSNDFKTREIILKRLERTNPNLQFRKVTREQFAAISEWHHYAIRELFDIEGAKEDPHWIQKRLQTYVAIKDIEKALATLEKLELLVRDKKTNRLKYGDKITSPVDIPDEALRQFHKSMLTQAADSITAIPVDQREISSMTFTISSKNLRTAKELVKNFYQEMTQLGTGNHDSVYHLEVALFPLTKKVDVK